MYKTAPNNGRSPDRGAVGKDPPPAWSIDNIGSLTYDRGGRSWRERKCLWVGMCSPNPGREIYLGSTFGNIRAGTDPFRCPAVDAAWPWIHTGQPPWPPLPAAAVTDATMPARTAAGSVGHAVATAAKSGSSQSALDSAPFHPVVCVFLGESVECSIPVRGTWSPIAMHSQSLVFIVAAESAAQRDLAARVQMLEFPLKVCRSADEFLAVPTPAGPACAG